MGLAVASVAALQAPPAAALDLVKIGYVASLASAPVFIAEAKGYFRDEGLVPELVRFDSARRDRRQGSRPARRRGAPRPHYFDPDIRVSPRDIQASLDWHYAQGMLKTPMEARDVIDFRYAIEAK